MRQADRDEGRRDDGATSAEREELRRLRRENKQLRQENEILRKAAAWFAQATLECELIDRTTFRSQLEAKLAIFDFIEGWYNPHRRHSSIGYLSPVNYERRMQMTA